MLYIPPLFVSLLLEVSFRLVNPQEFHRSYLGALRRAKVEPEVLPIESFIVDKITKRIAQENELAAWNGERAATINYGTGDAPGDLLEKVVSGYQTICKQETAMEKVIVHFSYKEERLNV